MGNKVRCCTRHPETHSPVIYTASLPPVPTGDHCGSISPGGQVRQPHTCFLQAVSRLLGLTFRLPFISRQPHKLVPRDQRFTSQFQSEICPFHKTTGGL